MTSTPQSSKLSSHVKLSLASLVSLLGTASAIYLTQLYYKIRSGTAGFQSLCNIGEGMSCDVVATSKWAELVPGLPLSSVVAGWFVALLILSLIGRLPEWRRDIAKIGAWMSGIGLLYGVFLLFIMFGVVKSLCVFCIAIDVANLILLGIFLSMKDGPLFSGVPLKRIQTSAIVTAISVIVMMVVLRPVQSDTEGPADNPDLVAQSVLSSKVEDVRIPETSPILGNPSAPVTIVEFSDFQCPYCGRAAVILNSVLARYPNQVRVVFRSFPLDNACNREIKSAMHPYSCALARSAYCSSKAGKFKPVYEGIFEEQASLSGSSAVDIAVKAGVPDAELEACLDSEAAKAAVNTDIEDGIALKIGSTPTLFVNGRRMDGAYPLEVWDRIIPALAAGK